MACSRVLLVVFAALGVVVLLGGAARGDGLGSITSGGVEVRASETVDSVDVRPVLSLLLSRDLADVQPGGRIVYSPTLTNDRAGNVIPGGKVYRFGDGPDDPYITHHGPRQYPDGGYQPGHFHPNAPGGDPHIYYGN